jgi:hypothetical protein
MVYNSGHLQADAYGSTRYFSKEDSSVFNISIPLDFFFNEKALELFAADLNKQMSATGVNLENDIYTIMLYNKLGLEMGEDYEARIVSGGGEFRKIPKELISTIFISDVKMKYNPRTRSLVSTDQIGIASVGKDKVQKYVDGKMEIQNKGTTFELTLALDLGGKDYYYFEFKGSATTGQVLTYSSNEEYNTMIKETKSDDRKAKTKGKEPRFNYYISTPTAFKKFIRMMEMKEN